MAKFKYKFESIKKVKETLEKKVQKEIAVIDLEIKKFEEEYKKITEEEVASRRKFENKQVLVGDIKFKKGYELCLQKQRAALMEKISILNDQRKIKLKELVQRSKEHKIFNKLEENYFECYNNDQKKLDLDQINEIATQKFVRQEK